MLSVSRSAAPRPAPQRPLRVGVLCSRRAPGLMYLLACAPDRGRTFDIVCCLTSEQTFAEEVRVERRGIPVVPHPIHEFFSERGASIARDREVRAAFDAETVERLEPYRPDLLLLDGYLYLVTGPILRAYAARILNLHFADLTLRREDGGPRFPGIRAVRDAIAAGCTETRATVHLVDACADAGPPIVRSWPFPVPPLVEALRVREAADAAKACISAHQQWMMRTVSGPLLASALRLVATGAVRLPELAAGARPPLGAWDLDRRGALSALRLEAEYDAV